MTQLAYQTVSLQKHLLTKSGGLCTTCCVECTPEIISSVAVAPANYVTYSGYFTIPAPIKTGYWLIYDELRNRNGDSPLVAYGYVQNYVYVGLSSQYQNMFADAATYFDFSVCCTGEDYIILPHDNLYRASDWYTWTPPTPGSFVTLDANTSLHFEPANNALYKYWGIGCWVDGAPDGRHIQVGRGTIGATGLLTNMKSSYSVPSSKLTGTRWYIYVYDYIL